MKNFFKKLGKEIKLRWNETSPFLFRIIQRISVFFVSLSGLVIILKSLDVTLPESIIWLGDRVIIISAISTWLVSKLPVDTDKASQETLDTIRENAPE